MNDVKKGNEFIQSLLKQKGIHPTVGRAPRSFRRIFDGKTFNSSTMTRIKSADHLKGPNCYHWEEELLQTRTGDFLLRGEGQPLSPWGAKIHDTQDLTRGYALIPMVKNDIVKWFEARSIEIDDEELAELFSSPKEANLLFRLPYALARKLSSAAATRHTTPQEIVQRLLEQHL